MKPVLYEIEAYVTDKPLAEWVPLDPDDIDIQLVAHVGVEGESGRDVFYFRVVTPKALARDLWAHRYVWGDELLVVERFDYKFIFSLVKAICDRIDGDSWEEIAGRLSRYIHWEFDGRNPVDLSDW
jgi:hypothetical protein